VPDARTLRRVEVLTMVTDVGELDVLARPAGRPKDLAAVHEPEAIRELRRDAPG
jgi:hypothetical protein